MIQIACFANINVVFIGPGIHFITSYPYNFRPRPCFRNIMLLKSNKILCKSKIIYLKRNILLSQINITLCKRNIKLSRYNTNLSRCNTNLSRSNIMLCNWTNTGIYVQKGAVAAFWTKVCIEKLF